MVLRTASLALLALTATLLADGTSSADSSNFDRTAASQALDRVDLAPCRLKKRGEGHVVVTFEPNGAASQSVVDSGPFASTKAGKCIAQKYKKTTVPAFDGPPVTVGKKFKVE